MELTVRQTIPIWWAFFWRAMLVALPGGFVAGFVGGLILGLLGHGDLGSPVAALLGLVIGFAASIWGLRVALTKPYVGYRLVLMPDPIDAANT